ncbi:MAG TPA: DUF484 family protein [Steroidobacteraceae bacterium]|nr:DUF484 family protein [Steroidobacteraceae bacterium]
MTTNSARGVKEDALTDAKVADHLQANPDFFERNAALLAKLRLPHLRDRAATVSLVERQVEVLRERNQALERRLKDLVEVARANDALADRIQRLAHRLLRARDLQGTVDAIETSMREDFDAMHAVLILFLPEARSLEDKSPRFLRVGSPADAELRSFESLLASGKPRCGQVRDSQRDYLFGKDTVEIGSVALTPLGPKGSIGLVAIGASDAERFHPAMSTDFLVRIGDLIAHALTR